MKSLFLFVALMYFSLFILSCEKIKDVFKSDSKELTGETAELGKVGTTYSSSGMEISGCSNFSASVISLKSGISSFSGTATCKNDIIKGILGGTPFTKVEGDVITADGIEFKAATDGIESVKGLDPGIIVKYDAEVGDTYPISTGGERKVVEKSTTDDYSYGFMLIKTIKVEETPNKMGVKKITYIANHKFGLVGIEFTFDDNSTTKFPIYASAEVK